MENKKLALGSVLIILAFTTLSVVDVIREFRAGETTGHLLWECLLTVLAMLWSFYLWYQWLSVKKRLSSTHSTLALLNEENQKWRKENERLIQGLSQSIDRQFSVWKLTEAEKDVALLLLKGLSFKEIAQMRSTSEKTTRQQALTIYQKSALPGRAELSAFFLEDLLGPKQST